MGPEEDLDFVKMLNEAKEGDEESEGFGKEFSQSAVKQITRPSHPSLGILQCSYIELRLKDCFGICICFDAV